MIDSIQSFSKRILYIFGRLGCSLPITSSEFKEIQAELIERTIEHFESCPSCQQKYMSVDMVLSGLRQRLLESIDITNRLTIDSAKERKQYVIATPNQSS